MPRVTRFDFEKSFVMNRIHKFRFNIQNHPILPKMLSNNFTGIQTFRFEPKFEVLFLGHIRLGFNIHVRLTL